MITTEMKAKLALFIKNTIGGGKMSLGSGGGSTNPQATTLDVPLTAPASGQSISSSASDDKVIEMKASFTGTSLQGYTVREMGIFGTLPLEESDFVDMIATGTSSYDQDASVMFSRTNFKAIGNFSTSDTIEVVYTIEVE
jgi:hypothetical protein